MEKNHCYVEVFLLFIIFIISVLPIFVLIPLPQPVHVHCVPYTLLNNFETVLFTLSLGSHSPMDLIKNL